MKRLACVLVHGIGNQQRYELLREFSSAFFTELRKLHKQAELVVDKVELNRRGVRTTETSDLYAFFGERLALEPRERRSLFRPVRILVPDDAGKTELEISFYEVYWADEQLRYTIFQKLLYNAWMATTIWNPLFSLDNLYRDMKPLQIAWSWIWVLAVSVFYHLAELATALVPIAFRRYLRLPDVGKWIYEYAGDVKLYVGTERFFHNQTKRDVILCRFDEVVSKAALENDEIVVVGHSLGSVIAFDGLTQHKSEPSKMACGFLQYLEDEYEPSPTPSRGGPLESRLVDLREKLKGLVTLGSPLDKMYFFWPTRRGESFRKPFRFVSDAPQADELRRWRVVESERTASARQPAWFNVDDVLDPIGAKLDFYSQVESFPKPENVRVAWRWLPSSAHTSYTKEPRLMAWLAAFLLRGEPFPKQVRRLPALWARHMAAAAFWLASAAVVACLAVFGLDFLLGFLHDLYMDAESHTVYNQLGWLDLALRAVRALLHFEPRPGPLGWVWGVVVSAFWLVGYLVVVLVASVPFARHYHAKAEARWNESRKRLVG